jgi:hypothetical protein
MNRPLLAIIAVLVAACAAQAQQPVTVIGPITPGDCPFFNSTTVIKDSGIPCNGSGGGFVVGPSTSVIGHIPFFNNTTGNLIADSGIATSTTPVSSGNQVYNLALLGTPGTSGVNTGLLGGISVLQNGAGNVNSLSLPFSYNYFKVFSDGIVSNAAVSAVTIDYFFGNGASGSLATGSRSALEVNLTLAGTTSNSGGLYTALGALATATAPDSNGNLEAFGSTAVLKNGATGYNLLSSIDAEISARTGSTVVSKIIVGIGGDQFDAVRGSSYNIMLGFSSLGGATATYDDGIRFWDSAGAGVFPFSTSATLLNATVASGTPTVKSFIDFSALACSGGYEIKFSQFDVDCGGSLYLFNNTAAISGTQQQSPSQFFYGQGWKTNSTAGSQQVTAQVYLQPIQGTSAPTSELIWLFSVNGGSYTQQMALFSSGVLNLATGFQIAGAATSGNVLRGNGTNFVSAQLSCADLSTPCLTSLSTLTIGTHLTGTSYNGSAPVTIATDATNANTFSTIVARDSNGSFVATDVFASGFIGTAAAPTVSAAQIGYGGTTAASSNCGSLSGAAGCVVINVAGTTHYVPYY